LVKKWIVALAGIALFVVAYFGSPYWAVDQLPSAAEAGQGDRLAQYADFSALSR
jgi:hypothetical protein